MKTKGEKQIRVFYDGSCPMCHRFIWFVLLRIEKDSPLLFSPIGGRCFSRLVQETGLSLPIESLSVYDIASERLYTRSGAIVYLLNFLGFPWKLLGVLLKLIPLKIRDPGYDFVAKRRRKVSEGFSCPLPPADLRKYLED